MGPWKRFRQREGQLFWLGKGQELGKLLVTAYWQLKEEI